MHGGVITHLSAKQDHVGLNPTASSKFRSSKVLVIGVDARTTYKVDSLP